MIKRHERHEKAWRYASEVIKRVTGETDEGHQYRLATDQVYKDTIHLITDMFLAIEKNHDFKNEINNAMKESLMKTGVTLDKLR